MEKDPEHKYVDSGEKSMDINYKEIADRAVAYAAQNHIQLDFSKESFEKVDDILEAYHEHISEYQGEDGAKTLWNIAVHFGIYLGETSLYFNSIDKKLVKHHSKTCIKEEIFALVIF